MNCESCDAILFTRLPVQLNAIFMASKMNSLRRKVIFFIFAQTIDRECTLEASFLFGSEECQQSMF